VREGAARGDGSGEAACPSKQVERRVGQCVLTSPTSAAFAGIDDGEPIPLGKNLRFFGDGFQLSKLIGGKRYWRIPVMDGEFLVQETTGMVKAVEKRHSG